MLSCLDRFFTLTYVSALMLIAWDFAQVQKSPESNFLSSKLDEEAVCGFVVAVQPQDFL